MKLIAILMVLAGLAIGVGAALEFWYYGPESVQFWVGVFATPAGLFFTYAGILSGGGGLTHVRWCCSLHW